MRHVAAAAATVDHQTHKNRRLVTRVTPKHGATYSRVSKSSHVTVTVTVTVCDPDLGPVNYWPLSLSKTKEVGSECGTINIDPHVRTEM